MFMSKDMFGDEDGQATTRIATASNLSSGSNMTRPLSSSQSVVSSSSSSTASAFSSSQSIGNANIASFDQEGQALTPAMRKQKMEELRLQQLGRRKGRMLVPTVVAKQDRPSTASSGPSMLGGGSNGRPSTASLSTKPGLGGGSGGALGGGGSNYHSFNRTNSSILDIGDEKDDAAAFGTGEQQQQQQRALHPVEREMIAAGISPIFDPNPSRTPPHASGSTLTTSGSSSAASASAFSLTSLSPLSLRLFLTSPCSPSVSPHQCYITRNKKGLTNRLYPVYQCTYESESERLIMTARKRSKNKTSNYVVTLSDEQQMIGKVRSNFVGTEFSVFDDGVNPDRAQQEAEREKRAELAVVLYESNILGSRGPRKMTVLIPAVKQSKDSNKYTASVHRPASTADSDSLLHHYKQSTAAPSSSSSAASERFTALVNKTPKWNEQVGAYVLNFNGRVTMASVKNFQLMIHSGGSSASSSDSADADGGAADERPCLQFGRVGKDMFTMDFGWPLSPLQAFAICLSSFDYKLACE